MVIILGAILGFMLIFTAVKLAINPLIESIDELKGTNSPLDIDLLIELRNNNVIEPTEVSALVEYRNNKRIESIKSNKFKRVESLLKEMRELDIYDVETFDDRLSGVKKFYGIRNYNENNIEKKADTN